MIVVDKNGEKFEMTKDANTRMKGDLKAGANGNGEVRGARSGDRGKIE